nr:MAG TPA: hypothetical protein [Inoviridae sp.]
MDIKLIDMLWNVISLICLFIFLICTFFIGSNDGR